MSIQQLCCRNDRENRNWSLECRLVGVFGLRESCLSSETSIHSTDACGSEHEKSLDHEARPLRPQGKLPGGGLMEAGE